MAISGIRKLEMPVLRRSMMLPGRALPPEKHGKRPVQPIALVEDLGGGKQLAFYGVSKRGHKHQTEAHQRSHLAEIQTAWKKLKRAGLPVPSFSVVDRRKYSGGTMKNPNYLQVIREDMRKRVGPLLPAHRDHSQITLRRLNPNPITNPISAKTHEGLIRSMAKDLTKMYGNGVYSKTGTIWHLYHKAGGGFERVIVNIDSLGLSRKMSKGDLVSNFNHVLGVLSKQMHHEAMNVFIEEVKQSEFWKTTMAK